MSLLWAILAATAVYFSVWVSAPFVMMLLSRLIPGNAWLITHRGTRILGFMLALLTFAMMLNFLSWGG